MSPPRSRTPVPPVLATLVAALLLLMGSGAATARVVPGPAAPTPAAPTPAATPATRTSTVATSSLAAGAGAGRAPTPPAGVGQAGAWRGQPSRGVWPLRPEPEMVRGFAPPAVAWAAGHRGVDLLGRPGQQVRAARAGTVTFAGRIAGRGVVVVSHGHTRTTYEPVEAAVRRGEPVSRGSVLGRLELLGSHCLPRACLHWGLLRGETYLDPLTLVGRGAVRLVPWDGLPVPLLPG